MAGRSQRYSGASAQLALNNSGDCGCGCKGAPGGCGAKTNPGNSPAIPYVFGGLALLFALGILNDRLQGRRIL